MTLELTRVTRPISWSCRTPGCTGFVAWMMPDEFPECKKCKTVHWFQIAPDDVQCKPNDGCQDKPEPSDPDDRISELERSLAYYRGECRVLWGQVAGLNENSFDMEGRAKALQEGWRMARRDRDAYRMEVDDLEAEVTTLSATIMLQARKIATLGEKETSCCQS